MAYLSLNPVVDVVVEISPLSATRRAFDLALIIGNTPVIPNTERVRQYSDTDAMLEDGFTDTDPEYLAAQIFFQQSPTPYKLLIGLQDTTAIKTVAINAGGTGYAVGDFLTVTQSGASGGILRVSTVATGVVTAVTVYTAGTGYETGTGLATTTTGSGTGCTIDISAIGEDPDDAVRACRVANTDWYGCVALEAVKADHLLIAAYIESTTPTSTYFYTTADTDVPLGTAGNIFASLKALKYGRTIGQYSTTSAYAAVSIMAYAHRNNTGLANSAYTLKFKQEPGLTVEPLTTTQVTAIEADNGNIYINRGYYYDMFEQGVMADGSFFDEVINLDMLVNNIQLNVMDKLYQFPKVPQTEAGVTQLVNACNSACDTAVNIGFLAPGTWTGEPVLNLNTGDTLSAGYLVQSETIAAQTQADREARKSPPLYIAIKEAGAIHSVTIGVYVNR